MLPLQEGWTHSYIAKVASQNTKARINPMSNHYAEEDDITTASTEHNGTQTLHMAYLQLKAMVQTLLLSKLTSTKFQLRCREVDTGTSLSLINKAESAVEITLKLCRKQMCISITGEALCIPKFWSEITESNYKCMLLMGEVQISWEETG